MTNKTTQLTHTASNDVVSVQATETSVYITDLLSELQMIAQFGGAHEPIR